MSLTRLVVRRQISNAGRDFFEEVYEENSDIGNIAGEFMSLNEDYVLLHQGQNETIKTVSILLTGFSMSQKKYINRLRGADDD